MGFHSDVRDGIVTHLDDALKPYEVSVIDALSITEAQAERFSVGVFIVRESIDYSPHPEVNPSTAAADQPEFWTWALYVIGGGGASRPSDRASHVDTLLETIRTALNAQRPTSDCGPLHLLSEDFEGRHSQGVMYSQRWTHLRME